MMAANVVWHKGAAVNMFANVFRAQHCATHFTTFGLRLASRELWAPMRSWAAIVNSSSSIQVEFPDAIALKVSHPPLPPVHLIRRFSTPFPDRIRSVDARTSLARNSLDTVFEKLLVP